MWQPTQSPIAASARPRASVDALYSDASKRAIGARLERQPSSAAVAPTTPAATSAARRVQRASAAPRDGRTKRAPRDGGRGVARDVASRPADDPRVVASWDADAAPDVAPRAADPSSSGCSAARTTSAVNGGSRKRTPVASKIAFAIAAVPGTDDDSPTPSGGSPGRGIVTTSITGTSRKLRIG